MVDNLLPADLLLLVLLGLGGILYNRWARNHSATGPTPRQPAAPLRQHSQEPQLFPGLTSKSHCALCEQAPAPTPPVPLVPPAPLLSSAGRPRQVDTSAQFCPQPCCAYYGWKGRGNIRANGYPNGGRWRQLQCLGCKTYFLETHGTPLHGKRVAPEVVVWAVGAVAEGLGIRAVARVFAVDPNTVLHLCPTSKASAFRVYDYGVLVKAGHHALDVMAVEGSEIALDKLFFWGHGHTLLSDLPVFPLDQQATCPRLFL
jgi:transposase-like protein